MIWSKLKKRFKENLADSLRGRIDFHMTQYGPSEYMCKEWITFDGKDICKTDYYDMSFENMFSREMYDYCSLSIEEIINSESPIIRAFGYLDKRFGKRKLKEVELAEKELLEVLLFKVRMVSEGSVDAKHDFRSEAEQLTKKRGRRSEEPDPEKEEKIRVQFDNSSFRKDPFALISAVYRGEKIDSPIGKALKLAFRQASDRDTLFSLVQIVRKKSKLLDSFEYLTGALEVLSGWGGDGFLRPLEDWEAPSHNRKKQFSSLARHLYAKFEVPAFLDASFHESVKAHQAWFKAIGEGKSLRQCDELPIKVTKKIAHYFMQAPADYTVQAALRYGQVLALGGDRRIADGLLDTKLVREFRDDEFWTGVLKFFISNPMLDTSHFNPIVDFIWNQKYEDQLVFVERRVAENRGPAQPNFSMRGRTVDALLRQVEEWHVRFGHEAQGPNLQWGKSCVADFTHTVGTKESKTMKVWRIRELLSDRELVSEGQQLEHCVASYVSSCHNGESSIWSLDLAQNSNRVEKRVTIEMNNEAKEIRQIRGKRNRLAKNEELSVIRIWAEKEEINIASYI